MDNKMQQKKGAKWMNPDNGTEVMDTDKQRILQDVMQRSSLFNKKMGRPLKYTPGEVEERIQDYFTDCLKNARRPTLTGMCNSLDIYYDTMQDWERDTSKPFVNIIKRAKLFIRDYEETMALEGCTNIIYSIFRDKAVWGLVEKQEVVVRPDNSPLGELADPEILRQRYLSAAPDID